MRLAARTAPFGFLLLACARVQSPTVEPETTSIRFAEAAADESLRQPYLEQLLEQELASPSLVDSVVYDARRDRALARLIEGVYDEHLRSSAFQSELERVVGLAYTSRWRSVPADELARTLVDVMLDGARREISQRVEHQVLPILLSANAATIFSRSRSRGTVFVFPDAFLDQLASLPARALPRGVDHATHGLAFVRTVMRHELVHAATDIRGADLGNGHRLPKAVLDSLSQSLRMRLHETIARVRVTDDARQYGPRSLEYFAAQRQLFEFAWNARRNPQDLYYIPMRDLPVAQLEHLQAADRLLDGALEQHPRARKWYRDAQTAAQRARSELLAARWAPAADTAQLLRVPQRLLHDSSMSRRLSDLVRQRLQSRRPAS